jgi:two-component system, OmpR family, sensor histidine kinase CreC
MSKRNRIFAGILLIFTAGLGFLLYTVASDLDIRYRESTEQVMVDTANILASIMESGKAGGVLPVEQLAIAFDNAYRREFSAYIYGINKHKVDLRVYVTDSNGLVVFDSYGLDRGKDFRNWHDIHLALDGRYGARTTRNNPDDPSTTVMYVAAPIYQDGRIVGAVSVSKAVSAHRDLLMSARQGLFSLGLMTISGFLLLLIAVTVWLSNPSRLTQELVQAIKQENLRHPLRLFRRLRSVFSHAFLDMRDAVAGRNFSEDYIQSLTHELKSPLTAIRGAAELLNEPMTEAQRNRFTGNITLQVQRLQDLAERLLELTHLEQHRRLDNPHPVRLRPLVEDVVRGLETRAEQKQLRFSVQADEAALTVGDAFLLQRALINLVENAMDFAPKDSTITLDIVRDKKHWCIRVHDQGSGIPDYAQHRLFDKFYSLRRPDSGQKSTGLGLPFVREIAHLHGGRVSLTNHPQGGALAILSLPTI